MVEQEGTLCLLVHRHKQELTVFQICNFLKLNHVITLYYAFLFLYFRIVN